MTDHEKELIENVFSHNWSYRPGSYAELSFRTYLHKPNDLYKLDELLKEDQKIADDIKEIESKLETLKAFRMALYERCQEVTTTETSKKVVLKREKNYSSKKVYYYVTAYEVFPDGKEVISYNKKYNGTDRKAAFEEFNQYVKEHPGIEAVKDVEKGRWER